jgi:lanosterol synthase
MAKANGKANGANGKQILMQSSKAADEKTDYSRWRLKDDRGCQTWHYLKTDEEVKAWPQSKADKYFLGLETVRLPRNRKAIAASTSRYTY